MQVDVGILFGIAGTVFGIAMAYLNWRRNSNMDLQLSATGQGELRTDIKYIKQGINDIKSDMRERDKEIGELSERVTRVEESSKQAHKRIDGIEKRLEE